MRTCAEERLRSHGRKLFRNRDINQLVQGNPLLFRSLAGLFEQGWLEPEREITFLHHSSSSVAVLPVGSRQRHPTRSQSARNLSG